MPAALRDAAEATERALRQSHAAAFGGQIGGQTDSA